MRKINDSYGPDIFRYKFTGQVEDKETGLYYYKARYYEPILGRFIQADSVLMPTNVNGMNRYMYVDGNPVNYRDVSGHVSGSGLMHMVNRIIGHAMGKDFNSKGLDKRLSTGGISKGGNRFVHNATFVPKGQYFFDGKKVFGINKFNRWINHGQGEYRKTSRGMAWSYVGFYAKSSECKNLQGEMFCELLDKVSAMVYNRENSKHDRGPAELFGLGWWNWKIRPTPEDDSEGKLGIICAYYKIKEGHACGFDGDSK
ncbi:RHS repeat-associated core domain protein [Leptospira noguchii str. 2001034031]|uniref:RHS repeat-associated core domain protein n=1 Tax=Leptospira noguchii str. 2001034031 TaxID=1193053 RepID=M6YAQ4_9LEPT|nr:RHS repeat-associated core domain protein [Leptospira noguchii str. 2001034031]